MSSSLTTNILNPLLSQVRKNYNLSRTLSNLTVIIFARAQNIHPYSIFVRNNSKEFCLILKLRHKRRCSIFFIFFRVIILGTISLKLDVFILWRRRIIRNNIHYINTRYFILSKVIPDNMCRSSGSYKKLFLLLVLPFRFECQLPFSFQLLHQ